MNFKNKHSADSKIENTTTLNKFDFGRGRKKPLPFATGKRIKQTERYK